MGFRCFAGIRQDGKHAGQFHVFQMLDGLRRLAGVLQCIAEASHAEVEAQLHPRRQRILRLSELNSTAASLEPTAPMMSYCRMAATSSSPE